VDKKLKIAYCTVGDPRDIRSWSGIPYFIMKSLEGIADIEIVGPLKNRWRLPGKIINKFLEITLKKKISLNHIPVVAKGFARQIDKALIGRDFDYIICPAGSEIIAYLNTHIPIVYISDTTFSCMIDYYPGFSNLIDASKRWGVDIEMRAIQKASYVICTSNWAAKYVLDVYNCPKEKMEIIPLGANMEVAPPRKDILEIRKKNIEKLCLLWVGVEWERKGGLIAYDAMVEMNRRGYETELVVCGCVPPIKNKHKGLICEGFLSKNDPDQLKKINDIYMNANIFIMPTKQECAGIVFSEASSYGLPILTFDTGGVSNYVTNQVNGFRLSLGSSCLDFVEKLEELVANRNLYLQISMDALHKYDNELNWGVWTDILKERLKKQDGFKETVDIEPVSVNERSFNKREQRTLIENFISLSMLEVASFILPLITLPYIFRVLGPAKFGIISFFQALNNYFVLVSDYGFNLTATKDVSLNRNNKRELSRIFTDVTFCRVTLALLTFIVMLLIVNLIDKFRDEQLIAFLFYGSVVGQVLFPQFVFQGMERMKYITIINVAPKLFFAASIFIFVKNESHYYMVPMFTSLGFCLSGMIALIIVIRYFGIKLKVPSLSGILYQLKHGWQVFQSLVSISFYSTISVLILGFFASSDIVGYYSAANRLISAAKRIIGPITQTLFPFVSKKMSESKEMGINVVRISVKILWPLSFLVSLFLFIFAPLIISLLYSTDSSEIIVVFRILAWTPFVISLSAIFGLQMMIPLGMKKAYSQTYLLAAILGLVLFFVLTPIYLHVGTAIAVLIVEIFVSIYMYFRLKFKGIQLFRGGSYKQFGFQQERSNDLF